MFNKLVEKKKRAIKRGDNIAHRVFATELRYHKLTLRGVK